jgi:two-component system sensor histidine kinase KdpD
VSDAGVPARRGVSAREWVAWYLGLIAVTAAMVAIRARLNEAHVTLAYLLIVQAGSARGGRPLGVSLAAVSFVCFDVFFLPPYGTLVIRDPLNWLVLFAFLATGILAAQLLARAQAEADDARQRAEEIDRLAALGAETLNAGRAEDALDAIVNVIRTSLGLAECSVYTVDASTRAVTLARRSVVDDRVPPANQAIVEWVAQDEPASAAAELSDGSIRRGLTSPVFEISNGVAPDAMRAFLRPLQVRGVTVGVLRVAGATRLQLSPAEVRVLDALSYYAALGVERVRLAGQAERAAALQEAHRAKDAVLASVSHDLRTPLTTIKGLAHEIAAGGDERAEVIEEEADRLTAFVAQLLDLSRISSGVAAPDIQPNEAEDLLGAAAQQAAGRLNGRELRITVAASGDALLFGRFDFSQTLRALVNLIENAAKYSPPDRAIDVSARRVGEWLEFAVADRGPGVAVEDRAQIFEPFFRRSSSSPDAGGVGLGLSIAQGIVEAQGGTVTLADRDGGGSVFSLRVPFVAASDPPLAES